MAVNKQTERFQGIGYTPENNGGMVGYNLVQEDTYKRLISNPDLEILADKRSGEISMDGASLDYVLETQPMNHFAALKINDGAEQVNHYFRNGSYEGTELLGSSNLLSQGFITANPEQLGLYDNPVYEKLDKDKPKDRICGVVMDFELPQNLKETLVEAKDIYPEIDALVGAYL